MNQEVPTTKKKEVPPLKHLLTVLGQCQRSLGTVQSGDSLGTVQSWDSLGPEQSWYSLGTVQSWDSGPGTVVLGH